MIKYITWSFIVDNKKTSHIANHHSKLINTISRDGCTFVRVCFA